MWCPPRVSPEHENTGENGFLVFHVFQVLQTLGFDLTDGADRLREGKIVVRNKEMIAMCRRGDIYLADCGQGDSGSSLQRGMRPVLVVSNDKANTHSPVVTVVPLTGRTWKKRSLPTHVLIPCSDGHGLTKPSVALAEQVTAIDKDRLTELWGHVTDQELMAEVTTALLIQIGVVGCNH